MRIAVVTVGHVYANRVVKELLSAFDRDIVFIGESEVLLSGKSMPQSLARYYKKSGLHYVVVQAVKLELYRLLSFCSGLFGGREQSKFYPYKKMARARGVPTIGVHDVNSSSFTKELRHTKADILVSVFFNQIIQPETIALPKKGVINIHPAYLPEYKGVSPVFWVLANKEKVAGVSIHTIDAGIDTGTILARHKEAIRRDDDEDSLYWRLCGIGATMLVNTLKAMDKGKVAHIMNTGGSYYSLPTKAAVSTYRKQGKQFFRLKRYVWA